ncbi:hypothetical protein [Microbacterium capsulatum]|uniref:ABC-2 type transport system permease protein n=1 Tax=Microbacterium capsulatum TaxID=3041921 RepID=A0ABU0XIY6_9MICO|nr:hypothetical protein [Microbacterium sp. ASV81]MDQ4214095.1 hypothetical protein [Microbacterium sp. ASV81]
MVAHVLRLRVVLALGALRGDRSRVMRTAVALALTIAATVVAVLAVRSLAHTSEAVAHVVLVLGSSAVVLGFFVAPILSGTVDQLDPRRFVVFGADARTLPAILTLAAFVSVPSLALLVVEIAVVALAIRFDTPWALAVLSGLLVLVTAVLAARAGMALSAMLLPERRSRELTGLFALAVIVVAVPVCVFVASLGWGGAVPAPLHGIAGGLGFTPFGAAAALPFAETEGGLAGGIAIAVLTAAVVAAGWVALVRRALRTIDRRSAVRERPGLGWFALLPSTAFGAVAARSLVYWLRDRRYVVNVVIVPIAGVLTVAPLLVAGVPLGLAAILPVVVMALFFGWLPHNDVAYDSTAFWIHVASGVRGVPDRLGRLVPVALIALPTLAVAIPITLAVVGRWSLLPALVGVVASLFLTGLGLASIFSVLSPYAVSRPGDSPFQQPQRSRGGALGQAGTLIGAVVLSAPAILLAWPALGTPGASTAPALWVGLVTGVVVLVGGVLIGGRSFERRGAELMEFVETA